MPTTSVRRNSIYAAIVAVAFLCTYRLAFHTFDGQDSIIYDGGFRVWAGQVPFRDFIAAVGPFQFWLCGFFFKWFGLNYGSYALMGAVMNAVGAALAMRAAWRLTCDHALAAACGLVTALWFMPIEAARATFNNFAYFCLMPALVLLVESNEDRPSWQDGLAGLFVAISFYSKQTIGGISGALIAAYLLQLGHWRRALAFSAAAAAGTAAATGWWLALDREHTAIRHLFLLPLSHRLGWTSAATAPSWIANSLAVALAAGGAFALKAYEWPIGLVTAYFMAKSPFDPRFPLMSIYFFAPLSTLLFTRDRRDRALIMVLILIQYIPHKYSVAEAYTYCPFMGWQALLFWKAYREWAARPESRRWLDSLPNPLGGAKGMIAATLALILFNGVRVSLKAITEKVLFFSVVGPAAALAGLILCWTFYAASRANRRLLWLSAASLCLAAAGTAQSARTWRLKHEQVPFFDPLSEKNYQIAFGNLKGLTITPEEGIPYEQTLRYLRDLPATRRPFFVFPDYSSIYFAVGQAPPQPFVWFIPELSYEPGPPDDGVVCSALLKNRVQTIVLTDRDATEIDLPCLNEMVRRDYAEDRRFELRVHKFIVYSRRHSSVL